jgi:hypothetical protein
VKGVRTRTRRFECPRRDGLALDPVTTVPRTLAELSSLLWLPELARAAHQAGVRHRATPAQVERALARTPRAKSAANLRRVRRGEVHVTLSELERRFLKLLREQPLPPATNKQAGARRVDCRWADTPTTTSPKHPPKCSPNYTPCSRRAASARTMSTAPPRSPCA